jgi:hypothetical protein
VVEMMEELAVRTSNIDQMTIYQDFKVYFDIKIILIEVVSVIWIIDLQHKQLIFMD